MTTPKPVTGGDDVRAIVVDCGTSWIRLGSSGDDTPRAMIPSAIAHRQPSADQMTDTDPTLVPIAGDQILTSPTTFRDITPIYSLAQQNLTIDWDGMQRAWQAAASTIRLSSSDYPFLIVEPVRGWLQQDRARALETAFEALSVPAAYVARGSAMSAFASARTTACVLDIGYQGACAAPVIDGYALQKKVQTSTAGGMFLSDRLRQWAEHILASRPNYDGSRRDDQAMRDSQENPVSWLRAHHELKRERIMSDDPIRRYKVTDISKEAPLKDCSDGHRNFYRLRLMDEMKMATFRVTAKTAQEADAKETEGSDASKPKTADGNGPEASEREGSGKENNKEANGKETKEKSKDKGAVGRSDEYTLPDGNTLSLKEKGGHDIANLLFTTNPEIGAVSVSELVTKTISASDVDLRRDLYGGVVITGGTSLIPGVVERITRELAYSIPQAYKLKVIAPTSSIERTCAPWIGGSIVSSLGTFQQVWISKAEYDELGSVNALRKCP